MHVWLRKKDEMTDEQFREYWVSTHAPIARDGYEHLAGYVIHAVTRAPEGQERPYDGIAELTWEDRDGFSADMKSEAGRKGTEDLPNFTSAFGVLFVDEIVVA
jgi:uncharacterized protein (TIGR02118 family)